MFAKICKAIECSSCSFAIAISLWGILTTYQYRGEPIDIAFERTIISGALLCVALSHLSYLLRKRDVWWSIPNNFLAYTAIPLIGWGVLRCYFNYGAPGAIENCAPGYLLFLAVVLIPAIVNLRSTKL